jgi:hypothetical protein
VIGVGAILCGVLHIKSGRSPFFWLAKAAIVADAALVAAWRESTKAVAAWWSSLPSVINEVKQAVAGIDEVKQAVVE